MSIKMSDVLVNFVFLSGLMNDSLYLFCNNESSFSTSWYWLLSTLTFCTWYLVHFPLSAPLVELMKSKETVVRLSSQQTNALAMENDEGIKII